MDCNCNCEMQSLLARYREYYDEAMPDVERLQTVIDHILAPVKQMEQKIKECVVESGESVSGHGVTVTYRKGYERSKWDSKGLQGYAVANPDVLRFHSVTKVGPTAAIKVE